MTAAKTHAFQLPVMVVGPVDLGRLLRELEIIDETLLQLGLRSGGAPTKMPKTTKMMEQTISLNELNLLQESDRKNLKAVLEQIRQTAPVIHISFSAEPAQNFTEKLMAWLRQEIHPLLLVNIGLQPNIGAGCIVRTANKQFDMSLRQDFLNKRDVLVDKLVKAGQPA